MTWSGRKPIDESRISRPAFLRMLDAALECRSFRFARQSVLAWLAVYPGDLGVSLLLGQTLLEEGKPAQAVDLLERLCRLDAEFCAAHELLARAYAQADPVKAPDAAACAYALGSNQLAPLNAPDWALMLRQAAGALQNRDGEKAEALIHQVLGLKPDLVLPAVLHLRASLLTQESTTVLQLASIYHDRWPDCLAAALTLADEQMSRGMESGAVGLLHQCVAADAAAQVATRLWGEQHRYQPLWPESLTMVFDLPIPVDIAVRLGWNQLGTGPMLPVQPVVVEPVMPAPVEPALPTQPTRVEVARPTPLPVPQPVPAAQAKDADIHSVEEAFGKLSKRLKKPELGRADGRFPMYVILSTRGGLEKQYGVQTRLEIDRELRNLADAVGRRPGWGTVVFYPDDPDCALKLGMSTIDAVDPWKIKLSIGDLDKALAKKGQMVGSILLVGGPMCVPYHMLPNPTDDDDREVPSDNPYATLDSNYFVPEWPVGRLPGESGPDVGPLLTQIRQLTSYHKQQAKPVSLWESLGAIFASFGLSGQNRKSLGYSAAVWRQSSEAVYSVVGDAKSLLACPPDNHTSVPASRLSSSHLQYFNLHGIVDGPDWYGQRDASDASSGPDYPVALSPKNISRNGKSPQVVFTEACYGGHVDGKKEDESLALKFLSIGTLAMVGSTTIAYGSVAKPLIGADLLGYHFWRLLRQGLTAGSAFMQAKIELVKEMNGRQGFLDGEDQKTLISFVLFGDPLAVYDSKAKSYGKTLQRSRTHADVKTICDRTEGVDLEDTLPKAVIDEVKQVVERYLPGMVGGDVWVSHTHALCEGKNHHCPTSELHNKTGAIYPDGRKVVTITKQLNEAHHTHTRYARVTLNSQGKMIKLAVSR